MSFRVIEVFGTERASVDYIFNNQSLPFLTQVTKSGATYKFLQALIYTGQEPTPIPFVSATGFLNADQSPFVAHIMTQVKPVLLVTCCAHQSVHNTKCIAAKTLWQSTMPSAVLGSPPGLEEVWIC